VNPAYLGLPTADIMVSEERVLCAFEDGTEAECDITNSHGKGAVENARFWGYDDHVRYYQHHDLIHCWLWYRIKGKPSPTLWAVAHGEPAPPENRDEEQLVNHVQYALAQDCVDEFARFFAKRIGPDYRQVLSALTETLHDLGLPFPPKRAW
jgi:hypothetical protein